MTEIGVNRVEDVVRAGRIRVALFPPQFDKDAASGELRSWLVDIARALGTRLNVDVQFVDRPSPRDVLDDLRAARADLAFMSIDRPDEADFTPPFIRIDFTCLVPASSSIGSLADIHRPGIRIAAVRHHASTRALNQIAPRAEYVIAEIPDAAFDLLRSGRADALASVRPWLLQACAHLPGARVLEDSYGANFMGAAVPKGHAEWLAFVSAFMAEAKASGLVQRAIDRAGWREVQLITS
jgi:polar amino acid transport system substrate-binding protein